MVQPMSNAPTILLLPGLLCDASVWKVQRPALETLAPVVVADLSRQSSLVEMAQSALESVSGPLIVIGHSMGARVAMEIWRLAPARVVKLALLGTGVHPVQPGEAERRQKLVDLAYREGMAALAEVWLPPLVDARRVGEESLMAPLREMVMRATADQHARQIKALIDRPDAAALAATISCPTLVMVGRQDRWSPPAQHEEIVSLVRNAKLRVVEDSGHMLTVEQPEATTRALVESISRSVQRRKNLFFEKKKQKTFVN